MRRPMQQVAAAALALVVSLGVVPAALAQMKFDASSGVGFVSKEAIEDAFGWQGKKLENHAASLEFAYVERHAVVVPLVGPSDEIVYVSCWMRLIRTMDSEIAYGGDTKFGLSGFLLTGYNTKFPAVVYEDLEVPEGWKIDAPELFAKTFESALVVTSGKTTAAFEILY